MSMTLSNVKDTNSVACFLVENFTEIHYESEDEIPPRHNEALNSMDAFLL